MPLGPGSPGSPYNERYRDTAREREREIVKMVHRERYKKKERGEREERGRARE